MIGVGVTTRNRAAWLPEVLEHLEATGTTQACKVVFSDDGSTDDTFQLIVGWQQAGRIDRAIVGPHEGVAANKNRLLGSLSKCDTIVLLDDDILCLHEDWHDELANILQERPEIGCLQVLVDGCKAMPDVTNREGYGVEVSGKWVGWGRDHTGAVLATTHEALLRVGFFDERFRGYGFEHCEWQDRFSTRGVNQPGGNPTLVAPGWFGMSDAPSCVADIWDSPEFRLQVEANRKLYFWGAR